MLFVASVVFACEPGLCTDTTITVGPLSSCRSIQAAVDCIPNRTAASSQRSFILVAPGNYTERVRIEANKGAVSLIGMSDRAEDTAISAFEMCGGADPRSECGTLYVGGDDFVLANMTLWNAPYVAAGKTFAIEVAGDRAAVYHSRLLGKDDVVFTGTKRVYFRGCFINGSTDFNFGQGSAVYDRCELVAQPGQFWSFITAHAGNISNTNATPAHPPALEPGPRSAYLIVDSTLPYCGGHPPARNGTTFLGRPWGAFAAVVFKSTWMGPHIHPAGWTTMSRSQPVANITFAEFNSTGPGADPGGARRVAFSRQLTAAEAGAWTKVGVLHGWDPPAQPLLPQYASGSASATTGLNKSLYG